MILAAGVRELGLKEHFLAPYDSARDGSLQCGADSSLEVVAPLIGRVDAPEARLESEAGQPLGLLLLPRRSVEELRDRQAGGNQAGDGFTRHGHRSRYAPFRHPVDLNVDQAVEEGGRYRLAPALPGHLGNGSAPKLACTSIQRPPCLT